MSKEVTATELAATFDRIEHKLFGTSHVIECADTGEPLIEIEVSPDGEISIAARNGVVVFQDGAARCAEHAGLQEADSGPGA